MRVAFSLALCALLAASAAIAPPRPSTPPPEVIRTQCFEFIVDGGLNVDPGGSFAPPDPIHPPPPVRPWITIVIEIHESAPPARVLRPAALENLSEAYLGALALRINARGEIEGRAFCWPSRQTPGAEWLAWSDWEGPIPVGAFLR